MILLNLLPDHKASSGQPLDIMDEGEDVSPQFKTIQPRVGRYLGHASFIVNLPRSHGGYAFVKVYGAPNWPYFYELTRVKHTTETHYN